MKPFKTVGIQYAALPYRLEGGRAEVMLITSRRTRRWIIPKGWPMPGLKPQEAAAIEATEEAGVLGQIGERPIGSYRYLKQRKGDETQAIQVLVFPLLVVDQVPAFKEEGQRISKWFAYDEAARLVAEPSLRRIVRDFGGSLAPNFLVRAFRRYWSWRFGEQT